MSIHGVKIHKALKIELYRSAYYQHYYYYSHSTKHTSHLQLLDFILFNGCTEFCDGEQFLYPFDFQWTFTLLPFLFLFLVTRKQHCNLPIYTLLLCCSVTQLCLTLCDPMDCSTPGFPVLHHLPELTQTHVHRVGDASK